MAGEAWHGQKSAGKKNAFFQKFFRKKVYFLQFDAYKYVGKKPLTRSAHETNE